MPRLDREQTSRRTLSGHGGEAQWLRLIEFIHPDSDALKPVINSAKEAMARITEDRYGSAFDELSAYIPPPDWLDSLNGSVEEWVDCQVEAVYEGLRAQEIGYAPERWDSSLTEQVIRTYDELLDAHGIGGPCLDLVLLMAGCLEKIGIHPLVVILDESVDKEGQPQGQAHAILAFWRSERPLSAETPATRARRVLVGKDEFEEERKLLRKELRTLIDIKLIDCTGLTRGQNDSFDTAQKNAQDYWDYWNLRFCLDVKVARLTQRSQDIQAYLRKVRDRLGRLPQAWYSPDADFSEVRVRVQAREGRRPYSEAEERERELRRRQGLGTQEDSQAAYRWRGDPDAWQSEEDEARPLDWDREVRNRLQRGIILGDPGFGKTWLLKHEAWRLAGEGLERLREFPLDTEAVTIPVYVRLADLARTLAELGRDGSSTPELLAALLTRLQHEYPISSVDAWQDILDSERCLLLLDGLDEVPLESNPRRPERGCRNHLCEALSRFADGSRCRIWLTSRTVGYQGPPFHLGGGDHARELELLPFDRNQQEAFAQAWFAESEQRARRFLGELRRAPQIQGLGQVPLLLGMLCKTYEEQGARLPSRRAALYALHLGKLLRGEWKDPRPRISEGYLDAKRELAEELAYRLFLDDKELFSWRELRDTVRTILQDHQELRDELQEKTAHHLIDELSERDGLLIRAGEGDDPPFLFLHLTFQEYLTACALKRRNSLVDVDGEQLPEWLTIVKARMFDPRWEEIIRQLASQLEDATPLIQAIWQAPEDISLGRLFLSMKSLADARNVQEELRSEILDDVVALFVNDIQTNKSEERQELVSERLSHPICLKAASTVTNFNRLVEMLASVCDSGFWRIIALLRDRSPVVRKRAAEVLGKIGDAEAVPYLLPRLNDIDPDVKGETVTALGKIGDAVAVPDLLSLFEEDVDPNLKRETLTALREIGDAAAAPHLLPLLKDPYPGIKENAGEVLERIADAQTMPHLLPLLEDPDSEVRGIVEDVLKEISDAAAVPYLLPLLKHPRLSVRWSAVGALAKIGDDGARSQLLALLSDPDPHLRERAVQVLGETGDTVEVPHLLPLLDDPDPQVRSKAVAALGRIGGVAGVPHLLPLLKDSDDRIRSFTASALGKIGDVRAVDHLLPLVGDPDGGVRCSTARALVELGGASAVPHLLRLLKDQEAFVRARVAEFLRGIGSEGVIRHLLPLLEEPSPGVRWAAAATLAETGDARVMPRLLRLLKDYVPRPLWVAAPAWGEIGDAAGVSHLLRLLEDRDPHVRERAADVAGKIGDAEAVPYLLPLLEDPDNHVRRKATRSMERIGDVEAVPHLLALLDHTDQDVRQRAVKVLGEIGDARAIQPLFKLLQRSKTRKRESKTTDFFVLGDPLTALARIGQKQGIRIHLDGSYTAL